MTVCRWASGSRRSTSGFTDPTTRCQSQQTWILKNTAVRIKYHNKPTVLQARYTGAVTSSMWRQRYNSVLEKAIRQTYNVKLHTELIFIEFTTTITLVLAMNFTDLISAGGHNRGSLPRTVNVGVNIRTIRLLSNEYLHTGTSGSTRVGAALLPWVWTAEQQTRLSFAECLVKQTQMVIEGWSFQGGQY